MLRYALTRSSQLARQLENSITRGLASAADFESYQENVKKLRNEPDNMTKLQLYALFKQGTKGDASGSRPGVLDFVGRAKFDAWNELKGTSLDDAKSRYVDLVGSLIAAEGGSEPTGASTDTPSGSPEGVEALKFSKQGKIFQIEFNRPDKKNAITWQMYEEIMKALKEAGDDKSTSVTVLTGVGDYFSSGNDLSNFGVISSPADIPKIAHMAKDILKRYVAAYIDHPKPLIALVNGPAIGISVTILGLFDMVLASDKATFVTPFAALGQSPEGCSSYTFPRIMGTVLASEFLLFGRKLSATEAHERYLVNDVLPDAVFRQQAQTRIAQYADLPPESLRLSKMLVRDQIRKQLHECNEAEVTLLCDRWQSQECMTAIQNFFSRK